MKGFFSSVRNISARVKNSFLKALQSLSPNLLVPKISKTNFKNNKNCVMSMLLNFDKCDEVKPMFFTSVIQLEGSNVL